MLILKSYVRYITMNYNNEHGHKGYNKVEIGIYNLGVKSITSTSQSNVMTQSYSQSTSQYIGRQPQELALSVRCMQDINNQPIKTTQHITDYALQLYDLRVGANFTTTTPSVNNIFIPGMYLMVTNNDSIVNEMPINSMWLIKTVAVKRDITNKHKWIFDLNLIRDEKFDRWF